MGCRRGPGCDPWGYPLCAAGLDRRRHHLPRPRGHIPPAPPGGQRRWAAQRGPVRRGGVPCTVPAGHRVPLPRHRGLGRGRGRRVLWVRLGSVRVLPHPVPQPPGTRWPYPVPVPGGGPHARCGVVCDGSGGGSGPAGQCRDRHTGAWQPGDGWCPVQLQPTLHHNCGGAQRCTRRGWLRRAADRHQSDHGPGGDGVWSALPRGSGQRDPHINQLHDAPGLRAATPRSGGGGRAG